MKAIVLAAGKGERLKGIINNIPKPMIRIADKPILEHNILLLKKYGITDIFINLHYYPEVIREYFSNGEKHNVCIKYSYEETLLGTAGAVRKIFDELFDQPERFILLYGDNLFDYDLREIIDSHIKKKGIATIALYQRDDVSQSGIVLINDQGKVLNFIEKPKPEEIISNLVNTGIYVLEPQVLSYITPGKTLDFGKDIFPKMILNNENVFGIIVKGKLIAIDTSELYKRVFENVNREGL